LEDLVLYLTYGQDDLREDKPFVAMVIMLGSKRYQLPSARDLSVVDDQNVAVSACAFPHHLSSEEREQAIFHRCPELLVRLKKAEQCGVGDAVVFISRDSAYTRIGIREQTLDKDKKILQIKAFDAVEKRSEPFLDNLLNTW